MLNWSTLNPSVFEKLCFRLISGEGFQNVKLYGGSGDRSRDIVAEYLVNTGASMEVFKFMIQCKRITSRRTLSISDITNLKNWMDSNQDFQRGLIMTSADVSPDTRDWLEGINKNRYKIEIWDKAELEKKLAKNRPLLNEYFDVGPKISGKITSKCLEAHRKSTRSKTVTEQVRDIKDETGCYIRSIIVNKDVIVVTYVDFRKDLKEFEEQLIKVLSTIGKMYAPSRAYRVTVNNNILMSGRGEDYPEILTAEIDAAELERFVLGKITLWALWEKIKFFRKESHTGTIVLNKFEKILLASFMQSSRLNLENLMLKPMMYLSSSVVTYSILFISGNLLKAIFFDKE